MPHRTVSVKRVRNNVPIHKIQDMPGRTFADSSIIAILPDGTFKYGSVACGEFAAMLSSDLLQRTASEGRAAVSDFQRL
eukprot:m.441986 g.441986  ORF g.441986 m.441986 type:complete len:79 (+) comp21471_c0_seq7:85-321(+)